MKKSLRCVFLGIKSKINCWREFKLINLLYYESITYKKLYFYYIILKPKFHFLKSNLLDLKIKKINTK